MKREDQREVDRRRAAEEDAYTLRQQLLDLKQQNLGLQQQALENRQLNIQNAVGNAQVAYSAPPRPSLWQEIHSTSPVPQGFRQT